MLPSIRCQYGYMYGSQTREPSRQCLQGRKWRKRCKKRLLFHKASAQDTRHSNSTSHVPKQEVNWEKMTPWRDNKKQDEVEYLVNIKRKTSASRMGAVPNFSSSPMVSIFSSKRRQSWGDGRSKSGPNFWHVLSTSSGVFIISRSTWDRQFRLVSRAPLPPTCKQFREQAQHGSTTTVWYEWAW